MDVIEGRGNEGTRGLFEMVRSESGEVTGDAADWGGEFDGIRSDEDFRRALAIEGVTTTPKLEKLGVAGRGLAGATRVTVTAEAPAPPTLLSRVAHAVRILGETLWAWRAIRLPMR